MRCAACWRKTVSGPKIWPASIVTFWGVPINGEAEESQMMPTNFCAENIAFMIGMYAVDRSGDTDRMRMRGSTSRPASESRWISVRKRLVRQIFYLRDCDRQQRALVNAPTSADGADRSSFGSPSSSEMRSVTAESSRLNGG